MLRMPAWGMPLCRLLCIEMPAALLLLCRKYVHYFLSAKQRAPEPGTGEGPARSVLPLTRISCLPGQRWWVDLPSLTLACCLPCPPAGQPSLTNKDLLEECVGSVLLALAVVMAGSGHLPTFKLLRGELAGPACWVDALPADDSWAVAAHVCSSAVTRFSTSPRVTLTCRPAQAPGPCHAVQCHPAQPGIPAHQQPELRQPLHREVRAQADGATGLIGHISATCVYA